MVGGGGREHALVWKIDQSPHVDAVLAAPGSDAIASIATCFPELKVTDADALIELARSERIDLVVIGPEDPLAHRQDARPRSTNRSSVEPRSAQRPSA